MFILSSGLAPISFSERAYEYLNNRKTKIPNWYLDMSLIGQYWQGERKRVYHHTAPINMLYALYQALLLFYEEKPENVFNRHKQCYEMLKSGLKDIGLKMFVQDPYQLPMLNVIKIPNGVDDTLVRERLREDFKIEIGAGLGPLSGKVWRIGIMGHSARVENITKVLNALEEILKP